MASANTGSGVAQHSRPLFGKISSTSMPSARLVGEALLDRQPALVAQDVLGLHARLDVAVVLGLLERLLGLHRRPSAAPRLTSCGRLPSVIIHSEPSSRRSMRGMRSRNSARCTRRGTWLGSWAWQSAEIIRYLFGSPGWADPRQPSVPGVACRQALRGDSVIVMGSSPSSLGPTHRTSGGPGSAPARRAGRPRVPGPGASGRDGRPEERAQGGGHLLAERRARDDRRRPSSATCGCGRGPGRG